MPIQKERGFFTMQIAALLSPSPAPKEGTNTPVEGGESFESQWNQAVQAQQAAVEAAAPQAPPVPEEVPVAPEAEKSPEEAIETVAVLPSGVPLQEWEALAWVQNHVPVVASAPVPSLPTPAPAAPPIAPEADAVALEEGSPPVETVISATVAKPAAAPTELVAEPPLPVEEAAAMIHVPRSVETQPVNRPKPEAESLSTPSPAVVAGGAEAGFEGDTPPEEMTEKVVPEEVVSEPPVSKRDVPDLPAPARVAAPLTPPPAAPVVTVSPPVLAEAGLLPLSEPPLARVRAGGPELLTGSDALSPVPVSPLGHEDLAAPLTASQVSTGPRAVAETSAPLSPKPLPARFELVQQMGERIRLLHHQGAQEVRVSLNPAHLGQVDIHLSRHEGLYSLHMIAETPLAKELLESQLGQLKQHLGQQGLLLEQASVDLGGQPEQGKQPAQEQTSASGRTAAFKLFPEADDTQEDGALPVPPLPDSAVNYLA